MNEQEWLECENSDAMIGFLFVQDGSTNTSRQRRLFVSACCRRIWDLLVDERSRRAVEASERFADGQLSKANLAAADADAVAAFEAIVKAGGEKTLTHYAACVASQTTEDDRDDNVFSAPYEILKIVATGKAESKAQCDMLRDIFNPFHPVNVAPEWLKWNDATVRLIAQSIYDERAFDRMPILADALEDAGCDNEGMLNHCRNERPHVRGCWVVDLLLGKQ